MSVTTFAARWRKCQSQSLTGRIQRIPPAHAGFDGFFNHPICRYFAMIGGW
jgi:hypothetical protein